MDKSGSHEPGRGSANRNYTFQQLVARFRVANPNRELPPRARLMAILLEKEIRNKLLAIRDLKLNLLHEINEVKERIFAREDNYYYSRQYQNVVSSAAPVQVQEPESETQNGRSETFLNPKTIPLDSHLNLDLGLDLDIDTDLQQDVEKMSTVFKLAVEAKIQLLQQFEKARGLHPEKMKRFQNLIARYIESLDYIKEIAVTFLNLPCICSFSFRPSSKYLTRQSQNPNQTENQNKSQNQNDSKEIRANKITLRCGNDLHQNVIQLWPFLRGVSILHNYLITLDICAQVIAYHFVTIVWMSFYIILKK